MWPQQSGVHHAVLQGQVYGEVSGRSLEALVRRAPPPLRDGQLRVVRRKRRGEEVWMDESLCGGAALLGRVHQEPVEQVHGLRGGVRDDLLQWDGWILLKGDFIVIWQLHHFGPAVPGRRSQNSEDAAELLDVVFSREQRRRVQQLSEDAAHRPQVDSLVVFPGSVEQLWGSVPPGGYLMAVQPVAMVTEQPGQTEVCDLQMT